MSINSIVSISWATHTQLSSSPPPNVHPSNFSPLGFKWKTGIKLWKFLASEWHPSLNSNFSSRLLEITFLLACVSCISHLYEHILNRKLEQYFLGIFFLLWTIFKVLIGVSCASVFYILDFGCEALWGLSSWTGIKLHTFPELECEVLTIGPEGSQEAIFLGAENQSILAPCVPEPLYAIVWELIQDLALEAYAHSLLALSAPPW